MRRTYSFLLLFACGLLPPFQTVEAKAAGCVAVFDFELADFSFEGEVKGVNKDEQKRLLLVSNQLRKWIDTQDGWKTCDMQPVTAEAKASNLSACGCIKRLATQVGGNLAVVSSVTKLSSLILGFRVNMFDVETGTLVAQLNADIRSNTDSSWARGLDWLIKRRLTGALAALSAGKQ